MKRFKVVAESAIIDAEVNVIYEEEAHEMYERFRDNGSYHRVYIMDNETGELYRTYDIAHKMNGVMVQEWYTLG